MPILPFKITIIFIILCLFGCAKPNNEVGPRVHNLAPTFINFWSEVKNKPANQQVMKFKADFMPKFPEFYARKIEKWKEQNIEEKKYIALMNNHLAEAKESQKLFMEKVATTFPTNS